MPLPVVISGPELPMQRPPTVIGTLLKRDNSGVELLSSCRAGGQQADW